eukprot:5791112-Pyramimonas_sp.AAC.1
MRMLLLCACVASETPLGPALENASGRQLMYPTAGAADALLRGAKNKESNRGSLGEAVGVCRGSIGSLEGREALTLAAMPSAQT